MIRTLFIAMLLALGVTSPGWAMGVFACEPEWAALAQEIGGDKVTTYTATTALQDPHQIQARPSLIAKARSADITVCTGAELEIGWLPQILVQAANKKIALGSVGSFEATRYVTLLERPARVDRAEGDIHAGGNPHIQSDPRNMLPVGRAMAERFAQIDPANAAYYRARYAAFAVKWNAALVRWQARAAPLRGQPIAVQHTTWIYLAQVLAVLGKTPVKMVIRSAYEDGRSSAFVSQRAHIPAVVLPYTIGGTPGAKDLYSLYDDTLTRLLGALK